MSNIDSPVSDDYDYSVLGDTYTPEQIEDFRGSAIDPALVLINCKRLKRQDEMIYALRKVDGHRKTSGQGLLSEFIKRQPIEWVSGGVAFWGYVDTVTAVQVKPDKPQRDRNGKPRKYESPAGLPPRLIIPRVTPEIWQRISDRVNVPIGIYTDYREWLIAHPQVWVCITEGYKKVLALLSAGYPAIGLTGINCWSLKRENEWEMRNLIPDFVPLVAGSRHFVNLFDCDSGARTISKVKAEAGALAKVLLGKGCTINRATWDSSNKGIDDLIYKCGVKICDRVISESKPVTLVSIDDETKKPPENMVAEIIAEEYAKRLCYCSEYQEWYWYDKSGKWIERNSDEIDAFFRYEIKKQVPNYGTCNYVNNVVAATKSQLLKTKWREASSRHYTPFKNGVLNLKSMELEPHDPEFYFRWGLDYDYDATATCEVVCEWLLETSKGNLEQVAVLRAYYKAILTGRTDLERFLECTGFGGSGKGTVTNIAVGLVGHSNVHFTNLQRMENDKFESASYANKRLIVISDSDRFAGAVNRLKELTGGDIMRSEQKYKNATIVKPIGLVWLNANEIVQSTDYTSGLARRRLSIPLQNIVHLEDRRDLLKFDGDRQMAGEFAELMPGIYNWVMGISDEDVKNFILNTEKYAPSLNAWSSEVLLQTNPLAAWLQSNVLFKAGHRCQIGNAREIRVSISEDGLTTSRSEFENAKDWLYPNYRQWFLGSGGGKPISAKRFRSLLLDLAAAQLKADVKDGKDSQGAYFQGLCLRLPSDFSSPMSIEFGGKPSPSTQGDQKSDGKVMAGDGKVMAGDGKVTAENHTGDGWYGTEAILEKNLYKKADVVVVIPPPPHDSLRESFFKSEKNGQNGCNPSLPTVLAVTDPSSCRHFSCNPSLPTVPAVTDPSTLDPNLMSMADGLAALAQLPTEQGLEGLDDLYSVWTSEAMSQASVILKSSNSKAYAALSTLVAFRNAFRSNPKIGDRVRVQGTDIEGVIGGWGKNRATAWLELDNGDLTSDYKASELVRVLKT